jgi:hypothetical protein
MNMAALALTFMKHKRCFYKTLFACRITLFAIKNGPRGEPTNEATCTRSRRPQPTHKLKNGAFLNRIAFNSFLSSSTAQIYTTRLEKDSQIRNLMQRIRDMPIFIGFATVGTIKIDETLIEIDEKTYLVECWDLISQYMQLVLIFDQFSCQ